MTPTVAFGAGNQFWTARGRCQEAITTTDAWLTICTVDTFGYRARRFEFASRLKDLAVRVLCSIDGGVTFPVISTASTSIPEGTSVAVTETMACTHVRVQTQPASTGENGIIFAQWWEQSY